MRGGWDPAGGIPRQGELFEVHVEQRAHAEPGPETHTLVRGPLKAAPPPLTRPLRETTGRHQERKRTLMYNVGSLRGPCQTQTNLPGTPLAALRRRPVALRGAPARAAHPALAEEVQAAALGLDIEGGAHRRPAGADPSGPEPPCEAAQARSPGPQSRRRGAKAAQPSGAQHRVPRAALSPVAWCGTPSAERTRAAFPRKRTTPHHVMPTLPGRGVGTCARRCPQGKSVISPPSWGPLRSCAPVCQE